MKYIASLCSLFLCLQLLAQEVQPADTIPPPLIVDTVNQELDIEQIEMYAKQFVPRRASLYAAVMPGAGQIYNRKYWKLPIVYGGFIGLGLAVDFYNDLYKRYRSDVFSYLDDPSYMPASGASLDQTRSLTDRARRERDFWIVMTGVFYLLQIADAHIDAHLKEFELNPKLQLSLEPDIDNTYIAGFGSGITAGLSLKLKFR